MTERDDDSDNTTVRPIDVWRAETHGNKENAYLIVVGGKSLIGKAYKIEGEMILGRGEGSQIVLDDEGVSRHHAKLVKRPEGRVELIDLNSTNGTFCNGLKVRAQLLNDGDKVQVGSTAILKFSYQDELDEQLQKNLFEWGTRDALTGLYNKKFFSDALQKEFNYHGRHNLPLTLIILDIDYFKKVNDTHGHVAGDHVLQVVAKRILDALRSEDLVARYGGEEMVAVLRETPEAEGRRCAERIRRTIESSVFTHNNASIPVTLSGGVVTSIDNLYESPEEMVGMADRCLYAAKAAGRNRVYGRDSLK